MRDVRVRWLARQDVRSLSSFPVAAVLSSPMLSIKLSLCDGVYCSGVYSIGGLSRAAIHLFAAPLRLALRSGSRMPA